LKESRPGLSKTIILVGLGEWDFKDKQTQLELVMMQVGKLFNFAIFALT
jgi:hypothetical protein